MPRDREGTFEPRLIPKHARRFAGFDDKILALYARGMTVREIQAFLAEMYAVEVSPDLISTVTDAVVAEVTAWQQRPLEPMYPVVFFDALRVKIRDEATVRSKAVYLALAVLPDGTRDILGIWIEQTEGAKFWMKVFTDLKVRGCQDILIAVTDGLKGHERGAGGRVSRDDAADLHRPSDSPQPRLRECARSQAARGRAAADLHGGQRRGRGRGARRVRARPVGDTLSDGRRVVAPRLAAGHPVLRLSARGPSRDLHDERARERPRALRKIIKTRGHFPTDEAATKLIWLALRNITARWGGKAAQLLASRDATVCDPLRGSLHPHRRMNARMDAAGPVDAKTASTGPWKTAQTAVSHSAHTPASLIRIRGSAPLIRNPIRVPLIRRSARSASR